MSLRTKLALILLAATVLPFGLGAAAMDIVVAPAYRREVARGSVEMTRRLSEHVAWNLAREVARLEKIAAWEAVRTAAAGPGLADGAARELDERWAKLPPESEPVRELLARTVSRELRWWQQANPSAVELFATNVRGQVVAASGKTSDFVQSDEPWWQRAYAQGTGKVYVSNVLFDQSAHAWVIEAAVPIFQDGSPGTRVLGVLKLELDVVRAFEDTGRNEMGDNGEALLADLSGRIITAPDGGEPLSQSVPAAIQPLGEQPNATQILRGRDDTFLYAWAQAPLPRQMDRVAMHLPVLFVVTRRSTAEAFAPLRMVQRWMLLISLITIAAAMGLGYWLADALLVRQVRTLALGMRELARGEFGRAAAIAEQLSQSSSPRR